MWTWWQKQLRPPIPDGSRVLKVYPELALLPDPQARGDVIVAANVAAQQETSPWHVWLVIAFIVGGILGVALISIYAQGKSWRPTWERYRMGLVGMPVPLAAWVLLRLRRKQFVRAIREQLIRRGSPVCLECGYDLQGQTAPRCPECGTEFDPPLLKAQEACPPTSSGAAERTTVP